MNALMNVGEVSMTSIEIAELVGKRHGNVLRTIRNMMASGVIRETQNEFVERINNLGKVVKDPVYVFEGEQGKRDSIVVVAQLSPEFTARLVDRWRELEEQVRKPALPVPQTMGEALRLAADLWEEKERLALENKEMSPKADVYDRVIDRNNLYNASQVAQKFGQSAKWMNKQLEQFGVYNRSVKRGRVFQQWFVDRGYGIMRETGNGRSQAMFYAEGEMWVIRKLVEEGLI